MLNEAKLFIRRTPVRGRAPAPHAAHFKGIRPCENLASLKLTAPRAGKFARSSDFARYRDQILQGKVRQRLPRESAQGGAPALVRKFRRPAVIRRKIFRAPRLHHCYDKIDGKDLHLLVEADLIAGCTEEDDPSAHAKAVRRLFKSASGLALLDTFIKE